MTQDTILQSVPCTAIVLAHLKNKKLLRALDSVLFFDEIIVVATTPSNREWQSFLKKHYENTPKLIHYDNPIQSFSQVRNWAAPQAENDWVFFLDSDEVLEPHAHQKLSAFFSTYADHYSSLTLTRYDVFKGQVLTHGEGAIELLRSYQLGQHQFHGVVHETVPAQRSFTSTITIKHYAHDTISDFLTDITRYAELASYSESNHLLIILFKMLIFPPLKWWYCVIIQSGWKDGWAGIMYATVMSIHSLAVRAFAYEKTISRT